MARDYGARVQAELAERRRKWGAVPGPDAGRHTRQVAGLAVRLWPQQGRWHWICLGRLVGRHYARGGPLPTWREAIEDARRALGG